MASLGGIVLAAFATLIQMPPLGYDMAGPLFDRKRLGRRFVTASDTMFSA